MLTCENGCNRPVCHDSDLCLRCYGAAKERARIIAIIENERDRRHSLSESLHSQGKAYGYRWCAEELLRALRSDT